MHTKRIGTIFLLVFSLALASYAGEEISKKELIIIHDKAITLIQEYQNDINKLGGEISDINKTKSNIESLIELFVNRKIFVYNDLDPAHQLSEFYEIETYASNLSLWYPDGQIVELELGTSTASNVMDHGENIYSIDVAVEKKIKGNYINKVQNTNSEQLLFRIAFVMEKQQARQFKIAGIRNAKGDIKPLDNLSVAEVKSANFSNEELLKIEDNCKSLLNDYKNYFALLGNPDEKPEDKDLYKQAIADLFIQSDNNVFNDLVENAEDKYLGIQEYIKLCMDLYPVINNISVNTDSATYSKAMRNDNGTFNIYMYAGKFFSAKQKGKSLYRSQNKMIIKISFAKKDKSFADFKILSIDNSGINEALASSQTKTQSISSFSSLNKLSRKGMYFSLNGIAGFSKIVNKNIAELDMNNQYHEWNIKPAFSYGGQLRLLYMFNDLLGVGTGLGYQFLKTSYSLSSDKQIDQTLVDSAGLTAFVDRQAYYLNPGDVYYKIIQVSYDSVINLQSVTIPLYLNFCLGKPNKIALVVKAGIDMMYVVKSQYSASGHKKFFAYLPDPQTPSLHFLYPEDDFNHVLGLYDVTVDKPEYDANVKKFAIHGVLSVGAEIPLGYFLSANAGVSFKTSLSDLSANNDDYIDIFGQTEKNVKAGSKHVFAHKPTKLQQYMFEIGIKYKF